MSASTHGRITLRLPLAALVVALALVPSAANALNEVHGYAVSNYGGSPACGPGFSDHSVHLETVDSFLETFRDLKDEGRWDQVSELHNTSVHGSYFTDDAKESTCACSSYQASCSCIGSDNGTNLGADDSDVFYIHTHGFSNNSNKAGFVTGTRTTDCTPTTSGNMLWDGDLDIAVIKACQTGDYDVAVNGQFWQMIGDDSSFRMWNSFHGNSSCGSHVKGYVEDYSEDSVYNGVGENWLDEAYDWDWGSNNDDCPTSVVFGSSYSNCNSMYRYGGWRDRRVTGNRTTAYIWYIGGCDPAGADGLPD